MGELFRAQCPKCGYGKTFSLGGGLQSNRVETALERLDEEEQAIVRRLQARKEIAACSCNNLIMDKCPCGATPVSQHTLVSIKDSEGQQRVYGGHCETCGAALVPLAGPQIPCPACGEAIPLIYAGLWD